MTNQDHIWLESGLEHDLLRRCDRDPAIKYIVSQPFQLSWDQPKPARHTPDLLTVGATGRVTVWDVRGLDEQNEDFLLKADVTRRCCEGVGWRYEVFSGMSAIERSNMLWLNGYRRKPEWLQKHLRRVRELTVGEGITIGELFSHDDGSGELKSVVWHLVWSGQLATDLTLQVDEQTTVAVNEEVWND